MSNSHVYKLEDFVSELSSVALSDILVNVTNENKGILKLNFEIIAENFSLPFSSKINQVYKIALNFKKNSDVQSLCLVSHIFSWKFKEKDLETPLFLFPLQVKVNKIKQQFDFSLDENLFFINPFLVNTFKKEFDLDLLAVFEYEKTVEENLTNLKNLLNLHSFDFELKNYFSIGNFHHHRYEIVKDLEEIIASKNENYLVKTLLGNPENTIFEKLNLSPKNCFDTDVDQLEIFKQLEKSNLVIQGPPGTGKSQVLANLISKLLIRDKKQLIVSEKKTALEVLVKKLKQYNLDYFAFVFHTQSKNGDCVNHLKNTWNFLENLDLKEERNLLLSEQYKQQIQLIFDKLLHSTDFPNYSLFDLQSLNATKKVQDLPYISNLPNLETWNKCKNDVHKIYSSLDKLELLSKLNSGLFSGIEQFDAQLIEISSDFFKLKELFSCSTLGELENLHKKAIRLQIIENESSKKYLSLVNSKSSFNKFKKLKEKYIAQTIRLELALKEILIWKVIPTLTEIESWSFYLEKGNWLKKRKIKSEIYARLSNVNIEISLALKNIKSYLLILTERSETEIELLNLGIEKPEIELNVIEYVLQQLHAIDQNELNEITNLSNNEKQILSENSVLIKKTIQNIKSYFQFSETDNIPEILNQLEKELPKIIALKEHIINLPNTLISKLFLVSNTEEFELLILKSSWLKFSAQFPDLAEFEGVKLNNLLTRIIKTEEEEQQSFAREICLKKKQKFIEYQELLANSSTKLSEEKKRLKKELKIGKAILIKEFSKSKQHKSLRELLESEAKIWIDLLCPIHLSTPTVVSKNYPLVENLFEFAIFDEASQMILPKAISCVQRAERMVIAGDSKQMSPSSFFAGKISSVDLLHQASYYLPNLSLKHHYRSIHPELIAFSNRYFYKNELIVYPSSEKKSTPISFNYIENGIFENRENEVEAQAVANLIDKILQDKSLSNKSIGVVTFSEQQLSCIWKKINGNNYDQLEERIKANQFFFKTLEQVQGEECDYLIISLAYAKDSNGKLHLRFGPLNQESGSKRLNVLFTRAKEKIDFFSSVLASDFEISTNESINLLRLYLQSIEKQNQLNEFNFPFHLNFELNENKLKIKDAYRSIKNAEELKTFQKVMELRGWNIEYEL